MHIFKFGMAMIVCLLSQITTSAQTPIDAIMMAKGDVCFLLAYEHGTWDEYWEGTKLQSNGNIGTLTRNTVHPGFAFGVIDRVNVLVDLPYVSTHASGGQMAGVKGFQDFSIAVKGNLIEKTLGKGTFYTLGTAGFSTRATNYLSDYQPFSLGLGTQEFSLRGIVQYKFDNGLYVRGMGAHLWRTETTAEREYYYNNGSYYTDEMDVPNAWHYQAVAGWWLLDNSLKVEAAFTGLSSTSGDDIRPWNAGQPTNQAIWQKIGGSAQYYFPFVPGLSALMYYNTVVGGRNTGKLSTIGGGLTYIVSLY